MKATFTLIFTVFFLSSIHAQTHDAEDILSKSISYHDPDGQWGSFQGQFKVVLITPGQDERISDIYMDQPASEFRLNMKRGTTSTTFELRGPECTLKYNGSVDFSDEVAKENRLTCERAEMYKNYYSYLYGLPMKLKDKGTHLNPDVQTRTFKGKEYLVLKVTYDKAIGEDTWYFYFDPQTYAMEVYQFFHDESKNDGEFILLEGEHLLGNMRLPKIRTWYTNKEQKLLGTDTLQN